MMRVAPLAEAVVTARAGAARAVVAAGAAAEAQPATAAALARTAAAVMDAIFPMFITESRLRTGSGLGRRPATQPDLGDSPRARAAPGPARLSPARYDDVRRIASLVPAWLPSTSRSGPAVRPVTWSEGNPHGAHG